jgi:hypothetical protein
LAYRTGDWRLTPCACSKQSWNACVTRDGCGERRTVFAIGTVLLAWFAVRLLTGGNRPQPVAVPVVRFSFFTSLPAHVERSRFTGEPLAASHICE